MFSAAIIAACLAQAAPELEPEPLTEVLLQPLTVTVEEKGGSTFDFRSRFVSVRGQRLHYVEAGEGPLVLFVHGFPSFWYSFHHQMAALADRYHVVAVDALGAGLSAKPEPLEAYRVDELAKQIDDLARHVAGDEPFVLVGHDWGAALGFGFAQAFPERLLGVVGLSAPPYNLFLKHLQTSEDQRQRSSYMQTFNALNREALREGGLSSRIFAQAYRGLEDQGVLSAEEHALYQTMIADDATMDAGMKWYRANIPPFDRLDEAQPWPEAEAAFAVPVLFMTGSDDPVFVADVLEDMREEGPHVSVHVVPGAGHWLPFEKPQEVNEALLQFLQSLAD